MAVRVEKMAGVSAPKSIVRRVCDDRPRLSSLLHDLVHFFLAADVMSYRHFGGAGRSQLDLRFMREIFAAPQSQLQSPFQLKKSDGAMLEFPSYDPFRRQPQSVAVKGDCSLQIVHAQGEYGNAGGSYPLVSLPQQRFLLWKNIPEEAFLHKKALFTLLSRSSQGRASAGWRPRKRESTRVLFSKDYKYNPNPCRYTLYKSKRRRKGGGFLH